MGLVHETKLSILKELAKGSSNGYQISENTGVSKGAIYSHLQDLQEEGMVKLVAEQEGGRQKKTYEITENGLLLLEALGER